MKRHERHEWQRLHPQTNAGYVTESGLYFQNAGSGSMYCAASKQAIGLGLVLKFNLNLNLIPKTETVRLFDGSFNA
jgi:hypothetical protein